MRRVCNCVKLFLASSSMCLHRTRSFTQGTLGSARNVSRLGALRTSLLWITIRRTSPSLFRCVMFDCAFCIQPFAYSVALRCPMTGWVCQWKPFWIPVDDSFKKAHVEEWVFQVTDTSDFSFSGGQVMLFQRLLKCRCLSLRHRGKHRNQRFQLVLGNVLRHHCLR